MSVNGRPCKWWKHVEVVAQLRGMGEDGVSLQVVSLLPSPEPRSTVNPWPGRRSPSPSPTQPWPSSWSSKRPQREGGTVAFRGGGFLGSVQL